MGKSIKKKAISVLIYILLVVVILLYSFNFIAMHYIFGIVSLLVLLVSAILSENEIIEIPKKQLICLLISLFTVAIIFVAHLVVINKPFVYLYEKTDSGIEITGYKKRIMNNYGEFYIEIPSHIKGEKVTKIKERAFLNSQDLFELKIPDTVLEIEKEAFSYSNLSYVTLSNNLKSIDEGAFYNTRVNYITIPKNVEYIGSGALSYIDYIALEMSDIESNWAAGWCDKSASIYFNSDGIEKYDGVTYVLYTDLTSTVVDMPNFSHSKIEILEEIKFNNKEYIVDTIGSYAGFNTTFEEIVIPNSIVRICSNAISNKTLKNIFIPDSVLFIEGKAFVGCDNLVINAEHIEKPTGWHEDWNFENREVWWKVSRK